MSASVSAAFSPAMPPPTIAIRGAVAPFARSRARNARPDGDGPAPATPARFRNSRRETAAPLPAQLGGRDAQALGGAVLLGQPLRTREAAVCVPS